MKRILSLIAGLVLAVSSSVFAQQKRLLVLFTSDLHSQALASKTGSGGYAALYAAIRQQQAVARDSSAQVILLDAGDLSMGTVFHTAYTSEAVEYRAFAQMGHDAFTLGNHDFDFGLDNANRMFAAARQKDPHAPFPACLCANMHPDGMDEVEDLKIFDKGGIKVGVFGICSQSAYDVVSRDAQRLNFTGPVEAGRRCVAQLRGAGADYIIMIMHGGTLLGDPQAFAKEVEGVDLIVAGHDHNHLEAPLVVNGCPIVSCGCYGEFLGRILLEKDSGKTRAFGHRLVRTRKPAIPNRVGIWTDSMRRVVAGQFKALTGADLYDTVAFAGKEYPKQYDAQGRMELGSYVADSYRRMAAQTLKVPEEEIIGLVPYGVVRTGLAAGPVTNEDVFNVLSLGENASGFTGYPLVCAWLSGREIRDICELTVSVAPFMEDVRLYFSGVDYSYNGRAVPFFRIREVRVNGRELEKDRLYRIVTGLYTARLIGLLESQSLGLLSAEAKDSTGLPLSDYGGSLLHDAIGKEIPEWLAFAQYLEERSFSRFPEYGHVTEKTAWPLWYWLAGAAVLGVAALLWRRLRIR